MTQLLSGFVTEFRGLLVDKLWELWDTLERTDGLLRPAAQMPGLKIFFGANDLRTGLVLLGVWFPNMKCLPGLCAAQHKTCAKYCSSNSFNSKKQRKSWYGHLFLCFWETLCVVIKHVGHLVLYLFHCFTLYYYNNSAARRSLNVTSRKYTHVKTQGWQFKISVQRFKFLS